MPERSAHSNRTGTNLAGDASLAAGALPASPPSVLTGRSAILREQSRLQQLADRSGQAGAADYLDYFLTQPYTGGKQPHLLLFEQGGTGRQLAGAVLVHQYRLMGMRLGMFVTEDIGGERNVLGPAATRSSLAVRAADHLLSACGAHIVVLSLQDAAFHPVSAKPGTRQRWATRQRLLRRRLPLLNSYDATLNTMGPHTRRNFRLFRRRALSECACAFVPHADLGEEAFIALNACCDYPVPLHVARWRYRSVRTIAGGVLAGVRSGNGEWISMVGGRRFHGTFAVDWQMNRSDFARMSPATLMRGYLMEHEVAEGTRSLLFQGGTPHSMQSAFEPEHVIDLVGSAASIPAALIRRIARSAHRPDNFLMGTLADSELQWHAAVEG